MIKKADIILFFFILIFGFLISWWSLSGNAEGQRAVITVDGQIYGVYDLSENQVIEVNQNGHQNYITIKDGLVSMSFSDCRNQVCVNSAPISQTKDTIVCLPNKVLIEIQSEEGGDVDVITG